MNCRIFKIIIVSITLVLLITALCHAVGISFSYFFPRQGYFANPIAPLNLKDVGLKARFFGLTSSISFFHMGGMNVKNFKYAAEEPLMGPFQSLNLSLTPKIIIPVKPVEISLIGGGFLYFNFNQKLDQGILDRSIAQTEGYDIVWSDFAFDNKMGKGYLFGGAITYYIKKNIGITLRSLYYNGESDLNLRGSYEYLKASGFNRSSTTTPTYQESKLDYRGLEVSIGANYKLKRK